MTTGTRPAGSGDTSTSYATARGIATFGGVVLATVGVFQFIEGLSAVLHDDEFVAPRNYLFDFNLTTWGWVHMVIGVAAAAIGVSIVVGWVWGYSIGVAIAVLSALSSFLFIPYYPIWGVVVLAGDIAVIWALCRIMLTLRREAGTPNPEFGRAQ